MVVKISWLTEKAESNKEQGKHHALYIQMKHLDDAVFTRQTQDGTVHHTVTIDSHCRQYDRDKLRHNTLVARDELLLLYLHRTWIFTIHLIFFRSVQVELMRARNGTCTQDYFAEIFLKYYFKVIPL